MKLLCSFNTLVLTIVLLQAAAFAKGADHYSVAIGNWGNGVKSMVPGASISDNLSCREAVAITGNVSGAGASPTTITSQSTGGQTQCFGGSFASISVTATGSGLNYQWYRNSRAITTGGTSLGSVNGARTQSYTPQTTSAGILYYYCIVTGSNGLATSAISDAFTVNLSIGGTLSGGASPLCLGVSTGTMQISGYSETIVRWERQINSGGWTDNWNNGNTSLSEKPWSAGKWEYRVVVQNGSCALAYSSVITIIVDPITTIGWLGGGSTPIYEGSSLGVMTLGTSTGNILRWEKRLNSGSWINILNTTNTYSEIPTAGGSWDYRVLVQSGSCAALYSNIYTIVVNPTLSITLGPNPTICQGTTTALLSYSAILGNPTAYSIDFDDAANLAGLADVLGWGLPSSPFSINVPYVINPGTYTGVLSVATTYPVSSSIGYPIKITVTKLPIVSFSYLATTYCTNAANPSPNFTGGGAAGTFSSTAGLVFFDTATGQVNLAASTPGTYIVTNTIAAGVCGNITATSTITVAPVTSVSLISITATTSQTVCINSPITNITYNTNGATGATVTGLPTGVTGTWLANVVTIRGTPAVSGLFLYTVTLSGGCGSASTTGSINIIPVLGTPVFASGSTSTRIQGSGTVTYTSSASNTSGITYTLDAASLAGGNSIVAATGQVIYSGTWTGTSIITASAAGCNGSKTATHTAKTISLTLGTSSNFALFTGVGALTNVGASNVTGDIGTNAGAFTGFPPGNLIGQSHIANATSIQATADVTKIFNDLAGITCETNLGTTIGNGQILTSGVYCLGLGSSLNGELTLDAQGDPNAFFIFKVVGPFSTSTSSKIILINSASLCNVYWQVNGAIDIGINSIFCGNIVANGAIRLLTGSSLLGRGLTKVGAISLANNVVSFLPAKTGLITGTSEICPGQSEVTYSVPALTNTTSYIWTLPVGATIVLGMNTRSITVNFGTSGGNITVRGSNSCGEGATSSNYVVTVTASVGTPVFTMGSTSVYCQSAGSITYTATATNTTGITYSLNAASISGGNSIEAATGTVTYVSGWSGTSIVTATACGCGSSSTATHTIVTTNSIVGPPVFTLGEVSTRCQGAASVTYLATATNSTGMIYNLDAASLSNGNTITSAGVVTYAAGWNGTSIITASAAGCSGPTTATHTVTNTATVGMPVFKLGAASTRCQGAGSVNYFATATNSTGITFSLDAASKTAGNRIVATTGVVTYVAGWNGKIIITAIAIGCNGSKIATHTAVSIALSKGMTSGFALFTKTGNISNSGASVVSGDVGTNVGVVTGFPTEVLNGQIHVADGVSFQAAADVTTAYTDLVAIPYGALIGNTLGGGQILTPNVYSIGAATLLSGDLTLDGQGDPNALFIIKLGGALTTNLFSKIILINSASLCNVYWQINGAVTLGESSVFIGTIFANGAINVLKDASLFGRGLSTAGLITLNNNIVNFLPAAAGTITGTPIVCKGQKGVAFSVPSINNAADYNWILPVGATIVSGSGTRSIVVDFSAQGGIVTVQGINNCGNGLVSSSFSVKVTPTVGTPVFTLGASSTRCQGEGIVIYTATATNSTVVTYSLDAKSSESNSINEVTGAVNYADGWSGTCTITASAAGCNGPISATHIVTITTRPVATFSYTGAPYYNYENPSPAFSGGGVAGTFSSTGGLVFVSATTGQINIAETGPGAYNITNTIAASGVCGIVTSTSQVTIVILPARTIISTSVGGDWGIGTTWVGGKVPLATDIVIIATTGAGSVTTSLGKITCAGITINSGSVLTMYRPFIVNGSTFVTGTINFGSTDASSNLVKYNGSVILNNGTIWNETTSGAFPTFTFIDDFINNSTTFIAQTGSHTFNGAAKMISGATTSSISTIVINGTYTNNGALTIGAVLTGVGGLTNGTTGVLNLGGTSTINTLTASAVGNTIKYSGDEQTIMPVNYGNLILLGSGTKTLPKTSLSIAGDFNISGTATATLVGEMTVGGNLTIANGTKLSISPAVNLTVTGTLTNNAGVLGFVLQSDRTGTATLIHTTNNVPATIQRYISGAAEAWHFLSSPVAAQSISETWLPSGTYGNGTGYDLYLWNESTNCWIYKLNTTSTVNWNMVHPQSNFVVGRGYLYSVQAINPTKQFIGNLNSGSVSYGLTMTGTDVSLKGFNLVGNPYPSSIDWSTSEGWIRSILVNSGNGYDMWIWNPTAENYGIFNSFTGYGTNNISQYIAPMQGYFVRAAIAGNLTTDNSVRVRNVTGDWKNALIKPDLLSLIVQSTSDNTFDEVQLLFGYNQNQTGAAKLFSYVAEAPSLYIPRAEEFYSVCYFTDTVEYPSVPVMFKPGKDGNYTLRSRFDYDQFRTVILEDRQMNVMQNMKTGQAYNFTALKTNNVNRFVLHFVPIKKLPDNEIPGKIYRDGINLIIDLVSVPEETEVLVYDVMGRKLFQRKLSGGTQHILNIKADTKMLLVYLKNSSGNLCRKIIGT